MELGFEGDFVPPFQTLVPKEGTTVVTWTLCCTDLAITQQEGRGGRGGPYGCMHTRERKVQQGRSLWLHKEVCTLKNILFYF